MFLISSCNTAPYFPASSTFPIYLWCLWCPPFIDTTIYVVALYRNRSTPSFKQNYMPLIFPKLTFNWSANVTTWVLKCMCATYRDMLEYYFSVHSRCHGFTIKSQYSIVWTYHLPTTLTSGGPNRKPVFCVIVLDYIIVRTKLQHTRALSSKSSDSAQGFTRSPYYIRISSALQR